MKQIAKTQIRCLQTKMSRGLLFAAFFAFTACFSVIGAPHPQREAFFEAHCYDCHDDLTAKGGLDLTALPTDLTDPDTLAKWTLIHDRVRNGEMPPEDKPQPKSEDRDSFVADLRQQLLAAEREIETERGKGLVRRMNRTEYEHTLQDLLALPLLRVKEMLPEDGQQHGFDKVPSALELSHVQIRKYLEAADAALNQAVVDLPKKPETQVWRGLAAERPNILLIFADDLATKLSIAMEDWTMKRRVSTNLPEMECVLHAATPVPKDKEEAFSLMRRLLCKFGADAVIKVRKKKNKNYEGIVVLFN